MRAWEPIRAGRNLRSARRDAGLIGRFEHAGKIGDGVRNANQTAPAMGDPAGAACFLLVRAVEGASARSYDSTLTKELSVPVWRSPGTPGDGLLVAICRRGVLHGNGMS